ncbi:mannose-6-phosphate isomerase-like protein (cupin superfamily) [Kitasatospora gansuensis]|uniref:Mannose-6-phosphate isomerase-like protein (Cupin superfamily) n=1 Tax=Kitasatospora gansuensis TaxID=258050 RepID=A0A7W7WH49_9ACTN|nr:cupin domain-containing protein [Kitasatospora gansuensis]MBB4946320.1 mannose-6-phosphate isomerase-like protein (cupin superfamily) [Kitasatospora gansuensis]
MRPTPTITAVEYADELIVAAPGGASDVYAMHGGLAVARWKCLARRLGLEGSWEAIEISTLPPGAECGVHHHSRTEELYFVVSGQGELLLNGTLHPVGPGTLITNPVGTRHRLNNPGTEDLDWIVIEVISPPVAATLTGDPSHSGRHLMSTATVIDLEAHGPADLTTLLSGPLREARLVTLGPGEQETFRSDDREHTLFVLNGTGKAVTGKTEVVLAPGTGVTLPLGSQVTLRADGLPLRFFTASLGVPNAKDGRRLDTGSTDGSAA